MADVGRRVVDFSALHSGAGQAGVEYRFVERDDTANSWESIQSSLAEVQRWASTVGRGEQVASESAAV